MSNASYRRSFLKTAAMAAVSSFGLRIPAGRAQPQSNPTPAMPRLLSGCCAYSYGKLLQSGKMTMEEFILKAVDLGLNGVDMTVYYLKSTDPAYLVSLRHLAFKNGLPFSGVAAGTAMCHADPAQRAAAVEEIKKWVDVTESLGASHLRVFGGPVPKGATDEQGIQWVVETMKPGCDYAAPKGITLGIESHGGITSKAVNILEILRRVDSPFAGCNLDITHFPQDEYAQIEMCVPYATHTHIRDHFDRGRQPIDLDRVWQMFSKAGYKGYMSAEYEGQEDPLTGVPKLVSKIKELCKKYSTV
jgi:sugar phosphate isomerase/epimerase